RQGAPIGLALLRLATRGALAQQPAHLPPPVAGHAPAAHGHTRLAPPPCGPLPPRDRAPQGAGHALPPGLGPLDGTRAGSAGTHPEVFTHPHPRAALTGLP